MPTGGTCKQKHQKSCGTRNQPSIYNTALWSKDGLQPNSYPFWRRDYWARELYALVISSTKWGDQQVRISLQEYRDKAVNRYTKCLDKQCLQLWVLIHMASECLACLFVQKCSITVYYLALNGSVCASSTKIIGRYKLSCLSANLFLNSVYYPN